MFRFQKYPTKGIYYKLLNICKGVRKIGAILSTQRSISLRGMESRAKLSSTIYSSVVYSIGNHLSFEPSSTSTGGGVEVVFHRSADEWRFWCNCWNLHQRKYYGNHIPLHKLKYKHTRTHTHWEYVYIFAKDQTQSTLSRLNTSCRVQINGHQTWRGAPSCWTLQRTFANPPICSYYFQLPFLLAGLILPVYHTASL